MQNLSISHLNISFSICSFISSNGFFLDTNLMMWYPNWVWTGVSCDILQRSSSHKLLLHQLPCPNVWIGPLDHLCVPVSAEFALAIPKKSAPSFNCWINSSVFCFSSCFFFVRCTALAAIKMLNCTCGSYASYALMSSSGEVRSFNSFVTLCLSKVLTVCIYRSGFRLLWKPHNPGLPPYWATNLATSSSAAVLRAFNPQ